MFRIKILMFVALLGVAANASAATKAIKFGKLWDGHKVINNAVVVVENDKIVEEIDALGGCVAHSYDRAGFRVATRDQTGHENRTRYDIHGNVKEQVDGEGRSTNYV